MKLYPEEWAAGPWRVEPMAQVVGALVDRAGRVDGGAVIIGVDGRSSSGKTSLAARMSRVVPGVSVVHTDDVAWRHSIFGWDDLLAAGVLQPVREGRAVSFRPPAWEVWGRSGAIEVPAGTALVLIEGVGAGRRELSHLLDATVWVQSDLAQTERRSIARVEAGELTQAVCDEWTAAEVPFFVEQRPWERASVIVAGTPTLPNDLHDELVVADPIG